MTHTAYSCETGLLNYTNTSASSGENVRTTDGEFWYVHSDASYSCIPPLTTTTNISTILNLLLSPSRLEILDPIEINLSLLSHISSASVTLDSTVGSAIMMGFFLSHTTFSAATFYESSDTAVAVYFSISYASFGSKFMFSLVNSWTLWPLMGLPLTIVGCCLKFSYTGLVRDPFSTDTVAGDFSSQVKIP